MLGCSHSIPRTCHACLPRPAVTASVYQMMRGAEMLFAALFAVVFLRRRCGSPGCLASLLLAACPALHCVQLALHPAVCNPYTWIAH